MSYSSQCVVHKSSLNCSMQVAHTWSHCDHPAEGVNQVPHQHALAVPPLAGVHGAAPAGVAGAEGLQVSCVIRQGAALQETVELKDTVYTVKGLKLV